ncbi:hypothetical protein D3C80_1785760 [compost metagenome]
MPEGGCAKHRAQSVEQPLDLRKGKAGQQHGVAGQSLWLGAEQVEIGLDHGRDVEGWVWPF